MAGAQRFRSGAPFRPWLLRIVINEAHNRRRSVGRQAGLALRLAGIQEQVAPGAESAALAGELRAQLRVAVAALREDDQLVIAVRYFLRIEGAPSLAKALALARSLS